MIELTQRVLASSQVEMERILGGLEKRKSGETSLPILPKNHPELIGHGETSVVLDLKNGTVGKINMMKDHYDPSKKRLEMETEHEYVLTGVPSDLAGRTQKTITSLREMGIQTVLPHEEVYRGGYPMFYYITPDLREGGRYVVYSIEDFPFSEVKNGADLKQMQDDTLNRIRENISSERYNLHVDNHGTSDKPEEALQHMFIGRIDEMAKRGELWLGDLNHLGITRKID